MQPRKLASALGLLSIAGFFACSVEDPTDTDGAAGATGVAGSVSTSGTSSVAGTSSAAGTTSVAGSNGTAGSGGASGVAGSSVGGSGVGGTGGGAAGSGGSGGSSAGSGGSGSTTATPSAGCGKAGKPANGKVTVQGELIVDFPAAYDGTKPYPLIIALHACGNQNTQWEGLLGKVPAFGTEYVRMMPNTTDSGQCWNNYNNNIARITKQYDDALANYCIDTSHVFAVGHSSGAQMLVNILSHKADADHLKLRGVAPVAADPYNVAAPIPVLYIDGIKDTQRSATSAANTVAKFRAANGCMDTSQTYAPIMGCKSAGGGNQVDPGCKIYDGCKAPTIWCAHNDPDYSNTQHGVPCFGVQAIYDFFKTL
ncbi:MAG TPA: hypothetical protein VHP33_23895 [Polyangiaceae bacterium]|nr:hypothetical protein [Polyangiaceae bacterium]